MPGRGAPAAARGERSALLGTPLGLSLNSLRELQCFALCRPIARPVKSGCLSTLRQPFEFTQLALPCGGHFVERPEIRIAVVVSAAFEENCYIAHLGGDATAW